MPAVELLTIGGIALAVKAATGAAAVKTGIVVGTAVTSKVAAATAGAAAAKSAAAVVAVKSTTAAAVGTGSAAHSTTAAAAGSVVNVAGAASSASKSTGAVGALSDPKTTAASIGPVATLFIPFLTALRASALGPQCPTLDEAYVRLAVVCLSLCNTRLCSSVFFFSCFACLFATHYSPNQMFQDAV